MKTRGRKASDCNGNFLGPVRLASVSIIQGLKPHSLSSHPKGKGLRLVQGHIICME